MFNQGREAVDQYLRFNYRSIIVDQEFFLMNK